MIAMRDCQYRNFSVTISGKGPPYAVSASYRGLSAAASFSQDALDPVWQEHLAVLSASHGNQGEDRLAEIGSRLFSELLREDVRDLWNQARSDLDEGGRLRFRLTLQPPAVAALPWETLHDPRRNQSFGADVIIALVRTQNQVGYVARPRALETTLPLMVLLVALETVEGLAQEIGQIRSVVEGLPPGRMEMELLAGRVTIHQIRERLLATKADILHIISHGSEDGLLLWADDMPAMVSAAALGATLQQAETLKLVFLNACLAGQVDSTRPFAGVAHRLLQSGLPAVIAMRHEILDIAAVAFAGSVYEALVTSPCPGHIDTAVSIARNTLYINDPNRIDYATPILWLNAEDGCILPFDSGRQSPATSFVDSPLEWAKDAEFDTGPQIDFGLEEKETWYQSLPAEIADPLLPFEYNRRRRILELLLILLRREAEEQEKGKAINVYTARRHLETFKEERRNIQNILDHSTNNL